MKLKYIGGGAWLPLVPARDLTEEEAKACGVDYLLKSGLYQVVEIPAEKPAEKARPEKKEKKESE
jgi:hypothetical protein